MDQVKVTVGAEVQGLDKIGTVNKELGNLKDNSSSLNKELLNVKDSSSLLATAVETAAGAFAAWKLKELIQDSTLLAARVETLGVVMKTVGNNSAYSASEMDAYAHGVAKMGITTEESRQTVIRMASAHMDLTKAQDLARVAQDAAVIANINSSEALQRMIYGIVSRQPEMLRTMELNVDFEAAYRKLAITLNKNVETLTDHEKIQAATNAVMEKGKDIAGTYDAAMGTAGKQLTSLKRYSDEAKLGMGELFRPALTESVHFLTDELKELVGFMQHNKKTIDEWGESFGLLAKGIADTLRFRNPGGFKNFISPFTNDVDPMYSGGLLDPSEQGRLAGMKSSAEMAAISAAKKRQAAADKAAKDLAEQKEIQALKKEWKKEAVGIQAVIDEAASDVSAWDKQLIEIDKQADQLLLKFGKMPGARDLINERRDAQKEKLSRDAEKEMFYSDLFASDTWMNDVKHQLTPKQQKQFDDSAEQQNGKVQRADYDKQEEQAQFDHNLVMAGLQHTITQNKYQQAHDERGLILENFNFEQQQAELQLQWTLDHTALEEEQKARILAEHRQKQLVAEQKLGIDLENLEKKKLQTVESRLGKTADAMLQLHNILGNRDKAAFRAYQAVESGKLLVSGYLSAQEAFQIGMEETGSYMGAAAYAAASAAFTGIQLAGLWSASPDGSGAGAGGSMGNPVAPGGSSNPVVTQPQSTAQTQQQGSVTFVFQGNVMDQQYIEEKVIPLVNDAGSRNIRIQYLN